MTSFLATRWRGSPSGTLDPKDPLWFHRGPRGCPSLPEGGSGQSKRGVSVCQPARASARREARKGLGGVAPEGLRRRSPAGFRRTVSLLPRCRPAQICIRLAPLRKGERKSSRQRRSGGPRGKAPRSARWMTQRVTIPASGNDDTAPTTGGLTTSELTGRTELEE